MRNFKRNRILRYAISAVLAVFLFSDIHFNDQPSALENIFSQKEDYHRIRRVVDGDTLLLANGERVRFIGIDTPEIHDSDKLLRDTRKSGKSAEEIKELGRKSFELTKSLCQGKKVRLEFDAKRRDRYNRLLAYIYTEDGIFLNAKLLEEGYAKVMIVKPNVKYAAMFQDLENRAKESKKGLWSK